MTDSTRPVGHLIKALKSDNGNLKLLFSTTTISNKVKAGVGCRTRTAQPGVRDVMGVWLPTLEDGTQILADGSNLPKFLTKYLTVGEEGILEVKTKKVGKPLKFPDGTPVLIDLTKPQDVLKNGKWKSIKASKATWFEVDWD